MYSCMSEVGTQKLDPERVLSEARLEFGLTQREVDVLYELLCGLRTAEIADVLALAASTVVDRERNLLLKTGTSHRSEMIAKVLGWPTTRLQSRSPRLKLRGETEID